MFIGTNEVDQVSVDKTFDNVLSSSVSTQVSTQNISSGIICNFNLKNAIYLPH